MTEDANAYFLRLKENEDIRIHQTMTARIQSVKDESYRLTHDANGVLELLQECFDDKELAAALANLCRVLDLGIGAPPCCYAVMGRIKELARQQAERSAP